MSDELVKAVAAAGRRDHCICEQTLSGHEDCAIAFEAPDLAHHSRARLFLRSLT
jgi:hypothetical protein